MAKFADYVDQHAPLRWELPLVHTTSCGKFAAIESSDSITPQRCPVFGDDLVYLFYGRPAYRSRSATDSSSKIGICPICFVFKPKAIERGIVRVFPFDSGGSKSGLFQKHIPVTLADQFQLTATIESVRRAASYFFETNRSYFLGRARQGLVIPVDQDEATRFYQMLMDDDEINYDDRRSAIEVQVKDDVVLRDALLAVILPRVFLQREEVRTAIVERWKTLPLPYDTVSGTLASESYPIVRQKLMDLLSQGDYL